ncbi:putative actin patch assembly and actin polymerization protein [Tulasnella sp. 419]|nr:putative actin patch assembly and actin polymerization protein [Tulasnella sp. 419]
MANDSLTDEGVKRKLMAVLKSWHVQFKDDPKMTLVAGLWASCGGGTRLRPAPPPPTQAHNDYEEQARIRAEQKAKERAAKEEEKRKEKERKEKERRKPTTGRTQTRKPFDFEKEKPQILTAVANASQASIQLGNALKLVNREKESIQENAHVQESLANAKAARKAIVRYVQLVENEELIGTLIDANERIITSLQLYDRLLKSADNDSEDEENAAKLASLSLSAKEPPVGEISKLQGKQRAEIQRSVSRSSLNVNSRGISRPPMAGGADAPDLVRAGGSSVHPDLKDLNWGSLGEEAEALPPPIRPVGAGEVEKDRYGQGSLSDYSDYDSSEDDRPSTAPTSHGAGPSSHRAYEEFVDKNEKDDNRESLLDDDDDPFADPFADSASIVSNDVVATDKKPDWR